MIMECIGSDTLIPEPASVATDPRDADADRILQLMLYAGGGLDHSARNPFCRPSSPPRKKETRRGSSLHTRVTRRHCYILELRVAETHIRVLKLTGVNGNNKLKVTLLTYKNYMIRRDT